MLTLYHHPLSSYCWKVLIALQENGTAFTPKLVDLGNPNERAAFAALWPTAKMPLLDDNGTIVPESSIQIEYLNQAYPGKIDLLPGSPQAQLEVRLWDRVFDQYVMDPMQRYVAQWLLPQAQRDPHTSEAMRNALASAYALIDSRIGDRMWAAGDPFTMADCAAAPALFYAATVQPFAPEQTRLCAYFERLVARPSVHQVIREARPWFRHFPLHDAVPERFLRDGPADLALSSRP